MNFFYSFTETLLHSLWQSALLLIACFIVSISLKYLHPLYKRNFYFSILGLQVFVSICTFLYLHSNNNFTEGFTANNMMLLNYEQQTWIHSNATLVFSIYLAIIFVKLCSMWLQWKRFNKLYLEALIKPSASLKIFTQVKAFQLGIKKNISIWYSQHVDSPITFGFLKPIILLPLSLVNNITTEEAESIILHELAHVKNNDYLLNWLLIVVDTLYFFNPFLKIITHKIKQEREKTCDVQVLDFGYDPLLYAQVLVKIAKQNNYAPAFQLAAAKKESQLLNRIKFFTDEKKLNFKTVSPLFITCIFLIVASFCLLPLSKKKDVESKQILATSIKAIKSFTKKEKLQPNEPAAVGLENKQVYITETYAVKEPIEAASTDTEKEEYIMPELPTIPENIFSTVAFTPTADSIKEVTINIETQQGTITQVYKLTLLNGKWIVQPQWMLVEKNADSNFVKMCDSLYNKMDSIQ